MHLQIVPTIAPPNIYLYPKCTAARGHAQNASSNDTSTPPYPHSLPSELWYDIFRSATLIPDAFDTSDRSSFNDPPDHEERKFLRQYQDSLKTKCALVSVCRAWRPNALPFLYEIIIRTPRTHTKLMDTLLRFDGPDDRCRYIRRFEEGSSLPNVTNRSTVYSHQYFNKLLQILPRCSRLEIYKHQNDSSMPASFLDALLEHCGPSLRDLELSRISIDSSVTAALASKAQNLRMLSIRHPIGNPVPTDEIIIFPTLHTLKFSLGQSNTPLSKAQFPQLQTLIPCGFHWKSGEEHAILESNPPDLRTIDLRLWMEESGLQRILSYYTSLETIILSARFTLYSNELKTLSNASLRQIGFDLVDDHAIAKQLEDLIACFADSHRFPRVNQIRIFASEWALDRHRELLKKIWLECIEPRGIVLDAGEGRVLRFSSS